MYYIYHIPKIKIGCTTQPNKRVEKQGYSDFEILEVHNNIDIASKREIELQKEYGYKVDRLPYKDSVNRRPKWTKSQSDKGRETMIKNGFFNEWYKKGNSARIKGVLQYTKDGKFVAEYKSLSEAARSVGKDGASAIASVCNGKKKSIWGYKWKYLNS